MDPMGLSLSYGIEPVGFFCRRSTIGMGNRRGHRRLQVPKCLSDLGRLKKNHRKHSDQKYSPKKLFCFDVDVDVVDVDDDDDDDDDDDHGDQGSEDNYRTLDNNAYTRYKPNDSNKIYL